MKLSRLHAVVRSVGTFAGRSLHALGPTRIPGDKRSAALRVFDRIVGLNVIDHLAAPMRDLIVGPSAAEQMRRVRRTAAVLNFSSALQSTSAAGVLFTFATAGLSAAVPVIAVATPIYLGASLWDIHCRGKLGETLADLGARTTREYHRQVTKARLDLGLRQLAEGGPYGDAELTGFSVNDSSALMHTFTGSLASHLKHRAVSNGSFPPMLVLGWAVAPILGAFLLYQRTRVEKELQRARALSDSVKPASVVFERKATETMTVKPLRSILGRWGTLNELVSSRLANLLQPVTDNWQALTRQRNRVEAATLRGAVGTTVLLSMLTFVDQTLTGGALRMAFPQFFALNMLVARWAATAPARAQDRSVLEVELPIQSRRHADLIETVERERRECLGTHVLDLSSGLHIDVDICTPRHGGHSERTVFSLEPGNVTALMGAVGSGKTNTLKSIVGAMAPESGTVRYNGIRGKDLQFDALREILHYVESDADPVMEETRDELRERGIGERQIIDALVSLGMDATVAESDARAIVSAGQGQLRALVAVLFAPPTKRLFVIDEGGSHLSSTVERRVMWAVRQKARRDHDTVLVVSHSRAVIDADKVVFLDPHGRVAREGRPYVLLPAAGSPLHPSDLLQEGTPEHWVALLPSEDKCRLALDRERDTRMNTEKRLGLPSRLGFTRPHIDFRNVTIIGAGRSLPSLTAASPGGGLLVITADDLRDASLLATAIALPRSGAALACWHSETSTARIDDTVTGCIELTPALLQRLSESQNSWTHELLRTSTDDQVKSWLKIIGFTPDALAAQRLKVHARTSVTDESRSHAQVGQTPMINDGDAAMCEALRVCAMPAGSAVLLEKFQGGGGLLSWEFGGNLDVLAKARGLSVVVATDDLDLMSSASHRIHVSRDPFGVAEGTPQQVTTQLRSSMFSLPGEQVCGR